MVFVADQDWVDVASHTTYAVMRRAGCTLNACVEAACIAVGVAEAFGYLCEPVPVWALVIAGKEATMLPGPGLQRRDGFAGHLLVHYPVADLVVDLTSDQFHAPKRGLHVPAPLLFPVSREDLAAGFEAKLPGGTTIGYRELPDDVSWRALPAWTGSSAATIGLVVHRLRAALADNTVRPRR